MRIKNYFNNTKSTRKPVIKRDYSDYVFSNGSYVIKYLEDISGGKLGSCWLCKCFCGVEFVTNSSDIGKEKKKSCGCARDYKGKKSYAWSGYEEISGKTWGTIKNGAKVRNIYFNISIEHAWDLFIKQNRRCAISNIDIYFKPATRKNIKNTASLDRINNKYGYIEGNIQWVHKHINLMKLYHDQDYFIELCNLVTDYQRSKVYQG